MKSVIYLLACVAYVAAVGIIEDDGQWRPWLDGSILGASPGLATATLGAASVPVIGHAGLIAGHGLLGGHLLAKRSLGGLALGHTALVATRIVPATALTHDAQVVAPVVGTGIWGNGLIGGHGLIAGHGLLGGHLLAKRSLGAGLGWAGIGHAGIINPNALNVPLDTVHVAAAKNAQLISQATEGTRNILGGGIPLALPADTHEVAAGKVAHAIAHETQKVATASHGIGILGGVAPAVLAAPAAAAVVAPRIVPAAAVTHSAQVVAPAVGAVGVAGLWGRGLLGGHGLVAGHGLVGGHGLLAGHW